MINIKLIALTISVFISVVFISGSCAAQKITIQKNAHKKTVTFGNTKLTLTLDYSNRAAITAMEVNGQKVMEDPEGIYSQVRTSNATYSSQQLLDKPKVEVAGNVIKLDNIVYGTKDLPITENWRFTVAPKNITFAVERNIPANVVVEEASLPAFTFKNINTWEGAYQGYGGLAWFYLFNERLSTYGVHTNSSQFWNSKTGNGLTIAVEAPGKEVAMKYSRTADDKLAYDITVSDKEMIPRFDSGTNRKRFIRQRTDVWAPFKLMAGKSTQTITLNYFDFNEQYGRGKFVGVNGTQVSSVLNTIARIGVIDRQHFGGNSWHTPYGPICLHEQYIAQLGLGINDEKYLQGYQECLDFYRDYAIKPDGRVWPRWAYNNVDIMPGQVTDKGFYEAQWGYLLDSNPDLVTNVAELFDQTGDKAWVKTHQHSCEKALEWIMNRDSDGDGLVEMMTDTYKKKRSSDWIDIIWASYENGFVNAKLYLALTKWAIVEHQLGNEVKAKKYEDFAAKLKSSFNKSTKEGGLWDEEKNCYIHWREKDNSIHGNNMVTPINFMAIAYGICDDDKRRAHILDEIEGQMQKEKLFFWPLCLYSYEKGEGNDWQFPFPAYENGDIFLSWGSVAVKAYASYKPKLALKYVKNVMARHSEDGLAFQRYGRIKQEGLGDDILSGNSLSVVGLYQAIYGINPLYNRFYLAPHITPELAGTELIYRFRGQKLKVSLAMNQYSVSNNEFKITAKRDFGFYGSAHQLSYFDGNSSSPSIIAKTIKSSNLTLDIEKFGTDGAAWTQTSSDKSTGKIQYTINSLVPNKLYTIRVNGKKLTHVKSNSAGTLTFDYQTSSDSKHILVIKS
jgi:hypothetical protein